MEQTMNSFSVPLIETGIPTNAICRIRSQDQSNLQTQYTGFLITGGLVLTTSISIATKDCIIEFNVPFSDANGDIIPSNNERIYRALTLVVGDNWGIIGLDLNAETKTTALKNQKAFMRLTNDYNLKKSSVISRIAGYGQKFLDKSSAYNTRSGLLQYSEGLVDNETNPFPSDSDRSDFITSDSFKINQLGSIGSPIYSILNNNVLGILQIASLQHIQGVAVKNINLCEKIMSQLNVDAIVDPDHPNPYKNGSILAPFQYISQAFEKKYKKIGLLSPSTFSYSNFLEIPNGTRITLLGPNRVQFAPTQAT